MIIENIAVVLIAVIIDMIAGDPEKFPHPVRYIGKLISFLEKKVRKNFKNLKLGGFFVLIGTVVATFAFISAVLFIAGKISMYLYYMIKIYIVFSGIAAKCLSDECRKVYDVLKKGSVKKARKQISYLVGRDTSSLDKSEIAKAAVETAAENTVDGVLAPIFYALIGSLIGLPAQFIYIYKSVNTLDSMIGYNNEKYGDIGFFSAKFDDILNIVPARIGGIVMAFSGIFLRLNVVDGFKIMFRDRKNHKSPNCAYPEGAAAGLLGVQLGGTHTYFGEEVYKPTIGDAKREIEPEDILKTTKLIFVSETVFFILMAVAATAAAEALNLL